MRYSKDSKKWAPDWRDREAFEAKLRELTQNVPIGERDIKNYCDSLTWSRKARYGIRSDRDWIDQLMSFANHKDD